MTEQLRCAKIINSANGKEVLGLTVNYHTHTHLCGHAEGEIREYIEKAIEAGLTKLGFADHAPQFFEGGYGPAIRKNMRMTPKEAEKYISDIRAYSDEYKGDIKLFCGFEAEYFPTIFAKLQSFCRDYGVDYLILGQHCLTIEPSDFWVGAPTEERSFLTRYVDEVLEGISSGSFSYVCHPDVCHYVGDDAFYRSEMTRLCVGAKKLGIPLEINIKGLCDNRFYPSDRFVNLAKSVGNDMILGVDAHNPSDLHNENDRRKVSEFLSRNGITPLDDITLRKI